MKFRTLNPGKEVFYESGTATRYWILETYPANWPTYNPHQPTRAYTTYDLINNAGGKITAVKRDQIIPTDDTVRDYPTDDDDQTPSAIRYLRRTQNDNWPEPEDKEPDYYEIGTEVEYTPDMKEQITEDEGDEEANKTFLISDGPIWIAKEETWFYGITDKNLRKNRKYIPTCLITTKPKPKQP